MVNVVKLGSRLTYSKSVEPYIGVAAVLTSSLGVLHMLEPSGWPPSSPYIRSLSVDR